MKKSIVILIVVLALVCGCASKTTQLKQGQVEINKKTILVDLAETKKQQAQGLSDRDVLPVNKGMLFFLDKNHQPNFWMKNMKFPLDFIWIKDNVVVEIDANIPVFDQQGNIYSNITSDYVPDYLIEVNAGFCQKNDIQIGHDFQLK